MFSFFKNKIIFVSDYDANIGNLSEKLFYILHKAKRENKQIIFVRKRLFFKFILKKIRYQQLTGMYLLESQYIYKNKLLEFILGVYFGTQFSFHLLFQSIKHILKIQPFTYKLLGIGFSDIINLECKNFFDRQSSEKINWSELYNSYLDIDLPINIQKKCKLDLSNLGVDENDWYVCLHIRTSYYHNDSSAADYRNSTPEHYVKMIKHINSIGGKVVRLGDPVEMSINDICIDYPNSNNKSEFMDLYLIKNCKFYIGTNSGILDTAFLFGVPVLGVNFSDFCLTKAFKSYDKILYKQLKYKGTTHVLSLKEIFSQPMYINPNINEFYLNKFREKYEFYENSEEELLLAVQEMFENLVYPKEKNEFDLFYDKLVQNAIQRWIKQENEYFQNNIEQAYRFYQRTYANGRVCRFQLEKNLS